MKFVLSLSICANLFLASCNLTLSANQKNNPTSNPTDANITSLSQRKSYDEIDLTQLPENIAKKGNSPEKLALIAFGTEEAEGFFREDIEVDTSSPEQATVTITQINLPDDSGNSIRYRIDFQKEGSQWRMEWAGQQFICQPGRGNQDWSPELCY